MLYELLVGEQPFPSEQLRQSGLEEIQRVIREEDPPKPSNRLTASGSSPAAKKGLRTGDVIVMVGQQKVAQPDDVVREVEQAVSAKRDAVLLLVERRGDQHFVALSLT